MGRPKGSRNKSGHRAGGRRRGAGRRRQGAGELIDGEEYARKVLGISEPIDFDGDLPDPRSPTFHEDMTRLAKTQRKKKGRGAKRAGEEPSVFEQAKFAANVEVLDQVIRGTRELEPWIKALARQREYRDIVAGHAELFGLTRGRRQRKNATRKQVDLYVLDGYDRETASTIVMLREQIARLNRKQRMFGDRLEKGRVIPPEVLESLSVQKAVLKKRLWEVTGVDQVFAGYEQQLRVLEHAALEVHKPARILDQIKALKRELKRLANYPLAVTAPSRRAHFLYARSS